MKTPHWAKSQRLSYRWFLLNGRFDGRFISLKQLRLHEPEARPKPQLAPV